MSNRLKAYCRRTLLAAARDYSSTSRRTAESTASAFTDAMRGTDTGWWNDLIYTAPMLDMAHRYRRDIATALEEYEDATGETYTFRPRDGEEISASRILSALLHGKPFTLAEYADGREGFGPDAALVGLRFAVEWYAGELARDYCPNL